MAFVGGDDPGSGGGDEELSLGGDEEPPREEVARLEDGLRDIEARGV